MGVLKHPQMNVLAEAVLEKTPVQHLVVHIPCWNWPLKWVTAPSSLFSTAARIRLVSRPGTHPGCHFSGSQKRQCPRMAMLLERHHASIASAAA